MTKADILDTIDAVLAENRQAKRRRMQAHVMWLLDNPTQLPIKYLYWDESTTEVTVQDLAEISHAADQLWKFGYPDDPTHLCVRCCHHRVEGDRLFCAGHCIPYEIDTSFPEINHPAYACVADLPQPLRRGSLHIRPMVSAS